MARTKSLRIGNAGGYWGDDPGALKRQVEHGPLDYITMDFLAEVTMSILQKQHAQNPEQGYARDFIPMLAGVLPQVLERKIRIITNAGGINPRACAQAIAEMAAKLGLRPKIAVVYGDDILPRIDALTGTAVPFTNMENGKDFKSVKSRINAANVYFGARPVVEALRKWQADIVITGRVTDTGITVAPMIYEFGWSYEDWDKIAAGVVAGHMLECGSQITGGNFSDWQAVKNFHHIGYPIVEVSPDGSFVLTKHSGTGGMVTQDTVREQLFYEMGNPAAYITPDVVADFSTIQLKDLGNDRVAVSSVRGYPPTSFYKVSMAYEDGFKAVGSILISGPKARAKAEKFAEIFWQRCPNGFLETATEFVGWNACHRSLGHQQDGNEIILRLGARASEEAPLRTFTKMIPSLILSGPPGVTVLGGVPKPQAVISFWPALLPKDRVTPKIALFDSSKLALVEESDIGELTVAAYAPSSEKVDLAKNPSQPVAKLLAAQEQKGWLPLYHICLARSGDKGDSANIGLLARGPKSYDFIKQYVSAQLVKDLFQELCRGQVTRYQLDGLRGLNFILDESLGGGGSCTLRADAQGKTLAQAILRQKAPIPPELKDEMRASITCKEEGLGENCAAGFSQELLN